ncbi:MAG: MoaD/ThiS family protein [Clostridiaceae bacterium]|nr:MoaD/ThiS family protein [Clostridiaceae bacterium]
MKIVLRLHHSLKGKVPIEDGILQIKENMTVEQLLKQLDLKRTTVVVTINKKILPKETTIEENDSIEIYPILIGG